MNTLGTSFCTLDHALLLSHIATPLTYQELAFLDLCLSSCLCCCQEVQ